LAHISHGAESLPPSAFSLSIYTTVGPCIMLRTVDTHDPAAYYSDVAAKKSKNIRNNIC